jgi:slime mold repeat-containing protein
MTAMRRPRRLALLPTLALAWMAGRVAPAQALTVTFDAGSGIALSYTEAGMTVAPDVAGFYVMLGDNDGNASPDIANHPGCCSTPYRFTYSGGVFSVGSFSFNLTGGGTHLFTSSLGAVQSPGASGTVTVPPTGWLGITNFTWHAPGSNSSETAVVDNLKFCPGDCDDGNACTTDACDPDSGSADVNGCTHTANSAPCDDGLFCNGTDTCGSGSCSVHTGDPCAGGAECANVCNEAGDSCNVAAATPCTDDGNPCTNDQCNGAGVCTHPNNNSPCNDGNPCTVTDACSGGSCVGSGTLDCDDHNDCTVDACNGSGCTHDPVPLEGNSCDDGNTCTENDTCSGGVCGGTPLPQNCDDGNPCTLDVCDTGTGGCLHPTAPRDGFVCDDTNTCTQADICQDGICRGVLAEADTDGDGFCDRVENQASCNPNDPAEIPPRAQAYAGAPGIGPGEGIITYNVPTAERINFLIDPACATSGVCGPIGLCTAGRVADPCGTNTDCDLPPNTCRIVLNAANVPALTFVYARVRRTDIPGFTPLTPGCSRKVDVPLDPARNTNLFRLKATGMVGGRVKRDRDRFRFRNF